MSVQREKKTLTSAQRRPTIKPRFVPGKLGAKSSISNLGAASAADQTRQEELEKRREDAKQKEMLEKLKPKHTMPELDRDADQRATDMSTEELDQFHRIDARHRNMQNYQFETLLREICAECIEPLRKRVIVNNEQIAEMTKDNLVHADKIDKLEIVYFNKEQAMDPATGVTRPINIFDTINNRIAEHATISRENEQALRAQVAKAEIHLEEVMRGLANSKARIDSAE